VNESPARFLDPSVLSRISRLELKARLIVEGFISGMHRSPYHGFSVEFAEHREYVPGDDIRHVDWKVYGRSDRYYIKQYEEETNLVTHILLDASESMNYVSDLPTPSGLPAVSKYEYGCYIAAALTYLLTNQQDAVGLTVFDDRVRTSLPPRSTSSQLGAIVKVLDQPSRREKTDIGRIFHEYAGRLKKRGLVVIISDMFDEIDRIRDGIEHLRHSRHELILFHVLDHDELTFPFQSMSLFEGLETPAEALVHPPSLRAGYLAEIGSFLDELRRVCRTNGCDYVRLDTRDRLDVPLSAYLAKRAGSSTR
jgi:uncharacterized protein (DUF58 family)